jgi:catechol 2,3-dioxygenase-like lactoylglutathione lyase family enzyme
MLLKGNLGGLQHLGLPVTNIERSKAFFANIGFKEIMNKDLPGKSENVHVVMIQLDGLTIEMYQLEYEERQMIAKRSDGHIDHIALDVMNINQAYDDIRSAGIEVIEKDAPVFLPFWEKGVSYFTIRGPDGEKIEFNQRMG